MPSKQRALAVNVVAFPRPKNDQKRVKIGRNKPGIVHRSQLPKYVVLKKGEWHVRRTFATPERDDKGRILYDQITRKCEPRTPERAAEISEWIEREYRAAKTSTADAHTLEQFCSAFLTAKKASVSRRTYEMADDLYARFIKGTAFGRMNLSEIKTLNVQAHYGTLESRTSPTMIRKTHTFLTNVFNQAVKWDVVMKNPCKGVLLPRAQTQEARAMSVEEARAFIAACRTDLKYMVFEFAIETGMRPSEMLALQWADIDFENSVVTVNKAVAHGLRGGGFEFKPPKTPGSRRKVEFSPELRERLLLHRERRQTTRRFKKYDLVFPSMRGTPMSARNLNRRLFKDAIKLAKLDPKEFSLYDLRHTAATLSIAAGADIKSLSEKLGNSVEMLLSTYSHVLPGMRKEVTAKLAAKLY